jgi:hypothetical protein
MMTSGRNAIKPPPLAVWAINDKFCDKINTGIA